MKREKKVAEAVERMKMLKMSQNVIREFATENKLNLSEGIGALYWLDDEEKAMVAEFEKEHPKYLVYHVIKNFTEFGVLYSLLFVNEDKEEWEYDKEDLKQGYAFCYVVNKDTPEFSEFGSIVITPSIGGLIRRY